MTLYSKKGHRGGLGCNKTWSMFALYNHTELWNCTNACSLSGLQINVFRRHQITHVWRDILLISNKLWPSQTYLGCSFCALALCTHSHHRLCHRRVKMQIINPILFRRKAGERDDLELWVWNPVWIVPNLTRVHWKCVKTVVWKCQKSYCSDLFRHLFHCVMVRMPFLTPRANG